MAEKRLHNPLAATRMAIVTAQAISNIISVLALIVSVVVGIISCIKSQKANTIANDANAKADKANATNMGQVEIQLAEFITSAQRYFDATARHAQETNNPHGLGKFDIECSNFAMESWLNAYEIACALYLDGKIDKKRFRRMYGNVIPDIVKGFPDKYTKPQTVYHATLKLFDEWGDAES